MTNKRLSSALFAILLFVGMVLFMNLSAATETANISLVGNNNYNIINNNTINLTVGAINGNLTSVQISLQVNLYSSGDDKLNSNSNGTSATNAVFLNYSTIQGSFQNIFLNFTNETGLVPNGTTRNFWFNIFAARRMSGSSLISITVNASNSTGSNTTIIKLNPFFSFSGNILNETGCSTCFPGNATNITIYGVIQSQNSPPALTTLTSNITNASGYFIITGINASSLFTGYRLNMILYNLSNDTFTNVSSNALKVGTLMPDFPAFMFYGGGSFEGEGFDMSLNGATFYLQPATTLNIWATNGTNQVSFGYELVDQTLGYPIDSNPLTKLNSKTIVVPANRGYTVSFFRIFGNDLSLGYSNLQVYCIPNNDFMNDTFCPAPPRSATVTAAAAMPGAVILLNQSLVIRKSQVIGCINLGSGVNNTAVNITSVEIKMIPWSTDTGSFIPPRSGNDGSINITKDINYTNPSCTYAFYNFSLLNNTGYMLEFYAKNASNESSNPGDASWNLAAFQNLTAQDNNIPINTTLYRLIGSYYNDSVSGVISNTSLMKINIINSTGGVITTAVNVNLKIKNSVESIGTVYYIIDNQNIINGSFYIPILNNSNFAKVMVFSQNSPPKESTINLSVNTFNITVSSTSIDKGFKKFNQNGSVQALDTSVTPIQMSFLRMGGSCDLPNYPDNCIITSMNASNFNPLKAMLAGKVNMVIKITSTNVSLIFHNYDMLSAKQPPMDSILNQNASGILSSGLTLQQTWNFGSFAPADSYKNVTMIIPYSTSKSSAAYLDDSVPVNISIPILYDEYANPVFNLTRGDTSANLTYDFIDYNNTFFQGLINSSGVVANESNISAVVFINKSAQFIAIQVPHFSTLGAVISSTSVSSSSSSNSSSNNNGGSSSGGIADNTTTVTPVDNSTPSNFWTNTIAYNDAEFMQKSSIDQRLGVGERVSLLINSDTHYVGVISLSATSVIVNVSSDSQQATLSPGDSQKFDVDRDGYYDIKITLNGLSSTFADLEMFPIHEAINPQVISGSSTLSNSINTTTLTSTIKSATDSVIHLVQNNKKPFIIAGIILLILIVSFVAYLIIKQYSLLGFKNKVKAADPSEN